MLPYPLWCWCCGCIWNVPRGLVFLTLDPQFVALFEDYEALRRWRKDTTKDSPLKVIVANVSGLCNLLPVQPCFEETPRHAPAIRNPAMPFQP